MADIIPLDLTGSSEVVKNLNKAVRAIEGRTRTGLFLAGLEVRKTALPLTPRDTGALRRSAFVTSFGFGSNAFVVIGYRQIYSIFVHEIKKNYREGDWKFLERAVRRSRDRILATVQRYATGSGKTES